MIAPDAVRGMDSLVLVPPTVGRSLFLFLLALIHWSRNTG